MYVCMYVYTAARDREDARDGLEVSESTLMGGADDDIRRRIEKQKERENKKLDEKGR